jgi:hypothetical protein
MRVRLWVPGLTCLASGFVFRFALGWDGITNGRLQYAQMALGEMAWYAAGLFLIALHLRRRGSGCGAWVCWGVGVLAAGVAVLSSCPP